MKILKSPFIPLLQRGRVFISPSLKKRGEGRFYVTLLLTFILIERIGALLKPTKEDFCAKIKEIYRFR
ncbi:MAG: hypothetical protein AAB012_00730 [Nitrospirota bacterium]